MAKLSQADHNALCQELQNKGFFIEVGWQALAHMTIPETASQAQLSDMRFAFFAGAQHLFSGIISGLDADHEPTDADVHRLDLISRELATFAAIALKRTPK